MRVKQILETIINAALKVHADLGNEFEKNIYQRALEKEMLSLGLKIERDYQMNIFYNGESVVSITLDFLVEHCIMLDIIALVHFDAYHVMQAKSYLEAYNIEAALLINFGTEKLQYKRVINDSFKGKF